MTKIATPAAATSATAIACARIAQGSLTNFRFKAVSSTTSPRQLVHRDFVAGPGSDGGHSSVGKANDTIGHRRNRGVVRDHHRRGAQLVVHALQGFEDDDTGRDVQR